MRATMTHHSEQSVIDAIDALVDEEMAGGECVGQYYDDCSECGHEWHGLECAWYRSDDGTPCGCVSIVQNERSIQSSSNDGGTRPDWIGCPANVGSTGDSLTNPINPTYLLPDLYETRSVGYTITMPNGDIVMMSGSDYQDVMEQAQRVIANIYEVMNSIVGTAFLEPPQTVADIESLLFVDVSRQP